jgi:site-specific DNA-methyltransferase (adenine-specific)
MKMMAEFPDGHFDLAVVDPPYGLGEKLVDGGGTRKAKFDNDRDSISWDDMPPVEYWDELERVSKNRIIWGGNYFPLPPTRCNLIWDKMQKFTGSDFELAWTSFDRASKAFRLSRVEAYADGKIHPTQKPVKLYDWIFANYATRGMKILDTHCGSGSIAIAAHYAGMHLTACELDEDYYKAACERIERETRQETLFDAGLEVETETQTTLL